MHEDSNAEDDEQEELSEEGVEVEDMADALIPENPVVSEQQESEQPVDEEADENIVEEIVINSSVEAIIDKFAGDEAINDNTIDPSIELAVLEAVDRVGEEADEDTIDKIARSEAVHDNTAGERVGELSVDPLIEAIPYCLGTLHSSAVSKLL